MPIYEYKCKKCNYNFEQLQRVTDQPVCVCPKCGKKQLIKLVSSTSFQLKGTGWYVTDFKNKKPKKEKEKNSVAKKDEKKDEKKDKTKSDEKEKSKGTKSK